MKTKLLKTLLIPSLGVPSIVGIMIGTTSCNSSKYLKLYANVDSTITFYKKPEEAISLPNLDYSENKGKTWQRFSPYKKMFLSKGKTLYLKGDNPNGWSIFNYDDKKDPHYAIAGNISLKGGISISGSILSLIDNGGKTKITEVPNYCFPSLFQSIENSESEEETTTSSDIVSVKGIFDKINNSHYSIGAYSFYDMFGYSTLSGELNLNKLLPTKCKSYGKGAFSNMFQSSNISKVIMPNIPNNVLNLKAKESEDSDKEDYVSYNLYADMFSYCKNLFEVNLNAKYPKNENTEENTTFLKSIFSNWLYQAGNEDVKCKLKIKYKYAWQEECMDLPSNWEIV